MTMPSRLSGPLLAAAMTLPAAILFGAVQSAAAETPRVIASIKPIHSLAASVMAGVGTPDLLIEGSASPHSYTMRPSDAARLDAAEVVFWIGPALESYLEKPVATLAGDAAVLELEALPGLTLLSPREGGVWAPHAHGDHGSDGHADEDEHDHGHAGEHEHADEHDHEHAGEHGGETDHEHAHEEHAQDAAHGHDDEEHDDGHGHAAGMLDAHLWLDPDNAKVIATAMAETLAAADAPHATLYRANAEALAARIDALDAELAALLAPVRERRFVVFHDAYQYFEAHYSLAAAGSITVSPDQPPGARRLAEVREVIAERGAQCVFREPQFEPALVELVLEGTGARQGELDPEAALLDAGPELYFEMMRGLARNLAGCLGEGS